MAVRLPSEKPPVVSMFSLTLNELGRMSLGASFRSFTFTVSVSS